MVGTNIPWLGALPRPVPLAPPLLMNRRGFCICRTYVIPVWEVYYNGDVSSSLVNLRKSDVSPPQPGGYQNRHESVNGQSGSSGFNVNKQTRNLSIHGVYPPAVAIW
ncbi:hypothetical protein AVEN_202779-1 [Araneus ventricosus]|uniref:Uncharacterized protein n=1 Tax=Araneus ventricosus TaxID=182803 RepID=A0A4Y2TU20_ARAVE|nr:hypothetical protein AVEN_202779-1 [Araneus ventricosus]